MQDVTEVFNSAILQLSAVKAGDLLQLTAERSRELGFANPQGPRWFGNIDRNSQLLLFKSDEKAKKYEDRAVTYLKSDGDLSLLAPAKFSMLKFDTKEYIGRYDEFVAAVNVAPYMDDNGILIAGPIQEGNRVYEPLQQWKSVESEHLKSLQTLTRDHGMVAWGVFMMPSNAYCHFHYMPDSFQGQKLPLVRAVEAQLYDQEGLRLAESGPLSDLTLRMRVVEDAEVALSALRTAEEDGIKSDVYVIAGRFLLLHYVADDNVVHYLFGRTWIPSPDGIGFTLDDERIRKFPPLDVVRDFWVQKNSQLRRLDKLNP